MTRSMITTGYVRMAARATPERQIRAVGISGDELTPIAGIWPLFAGGQQVGQVTSAGWSPDVNTTVSIAMVDRSHWDAGTRLEVETTDGMRPATVHAKFWI